VGTFFVGKCIKSAKLTQNETKNKVFVTYKKVFWANYIYFCHQQKYKESKTIKITSNQLNLSMPM
jgi:hypothetical protein